MGMIIRPMKKEEIKYSYRQSYQINGQTGYIGYLKGYLSETSFEPFWEGGKITNFFEDFDKDFTEVIETLKANEMFAEMFKKRSAISQFIAEHPDYCIDGDCGKECGVTVETDGYTYFMRFIPLEGVDNMYFHCYRRNWLECHIKNARAGIRFITPKYENLFVIEDGGKILFERPGDEPKEKVCRYIDSCHVEIDDTIYHICQFAEMCEKIGAKCTPVK